MSDGVAVSVETPIAFSRACVTSPGSADPSEPFVGERAFRAEDAQRLAVSARDTDTTALYVDRRLVTADGDTRASERVPFAPLEARSPIDAMENRGVRGGRVGCQAARRSAA